MAENLARVMAESNKTQRINSLDSDPFGLIDIGIAISSRWKLFVAVFLLAVFSGAAFIALSPNIYEARAVVFLGRMPDSMRNLIPSTEQARNRLDEQYDIHNRFGRDFDKPYLYAVVEKGGFLVLSARGNVQDQTLSLLQQVVLDLQTEINLTTQPAKEALLNERDSLHRYLQDARKLITTWNASDAGKSQQKLESLAGLSVLERARTMENILSAESRLTELNLNLLTLNTGAFSVAREAQLLRAGAPIRPRPLLYLAIAIVLGLIFGSLAVASVSMLAQIKKRLAIV